MKTFPQHCREEPGSSAEPTPRLRLLNPYCAAWLSMTAFSRGLTQKTPSVFYTSCPEAHCPLVCLSWGALPATQDGNIGEASCWTASWCRFALGDSKSHIAWSSAQITSGGINHLTGCDSMIITYKCKDKSQLVVNALQHRVETSLLLMLHVWIFSSEREYPYLLSGFCFTCIWPVCHYQAGFRKVDVKTLKNKCISWFMFLLL